MRSDPNSKARLSVVVKQKVTDEPLVQTYHRKLTKRDSVFTGIRERAVHEPHGEATLIRRPYEPSSYGTANEKLRETESSCYFAGRMDWLKAQSGVH